MEALAELSREIEQVDDDDDGCEVRILRLCCMGVLAVYLNLDVLLKVCDEDVGFSASVLSTHAGK